MKIIRERNRRNKKGEFYDVLADGIRRIRHQNNGDVQIFLESSSFGGYATSVCLTSDDIKKIVGE